VISLATWTLWVHILAAAVWLGGAAMARVAIVPLAEEARAAAARRGHFLTSRAMEILILTGLVNILFKGLESSFALSAGFFAMLSVKMALLAVMVGLQIWMGVAWRRGEVELPDATRRARLGLTVQCLLGAVAALLGLGLRAA
jgi:uncharacterized membrane protein